MRHDLGPSPKLAPHRPSPMAGASVSPLHAPPARLAGSPSAHLEQSEDLMEADPLDNELRPVLEEAETGPMAGPAGGRSV